MAPQNCGLLAKLDQCPDSLCLDNRRKIGYNSKVKLGKDQTVAGNKMLPGCSSPLPVTCPPFAVRCFPLPIHLCALPSGEDCAATLPPASCRWRGQARGKKRLQSVDNGRPCRGTACRPLPVGRWPAGRASPTPTPPECGQVGCRGAWPRAPTSFSAVIEGLGKGRRGAGCALNDK